MDLKKTGNLISNARKEKGITQKELAEKLHISDRTVSKWERGAGFPDVSILTELADILGLTVTELLQGELMPESDSDLGSDLTIREAVNALYQQTAAKAKPPSASPLSNAIRVSFPIILHLSLALSASPHPKLRTVTASDCVPTFPAIPKISD